MRARLARVLLLAVLLFGWQAALEHPLEHASHEASSLCDVLDALTACAFGSPAIFAADFPPREDPSYPVLVRRAAEAPPFYSHGPPAYA